MKNSLIKLIEAKDYKEILKWATNLSDEERYKSLDILKTIHLVDDIIKEPVPQQYSQKYYDNRTLLDSILTFMKICCVRSEKDLKLIPFEWDKNFSLLTSYFQKPVFGAEPLVEYFNQYPPDYLDKIVLQLLSERQNNNDFHLLWLLYKNGHISFNEEVFVRSLFIILMFKRNTMSDVEFIRNNPEIIDKILLQFYKYEIPILDISKWQAKQEYVCKRCTEYWNEVFEELLSLGLLTDRTIVRNLLSTLSYNWKKGHLDWHVRLIKIFNPTKEEYLSNQDLLFAGLYSSNITVSNYVVSVIETIYKNEQFDKDSFFQSIPSLLVKEKSDKSIIASLSIIAYLIEENVDLKQYSTLIANALMQLSDAIQCKTAELLVKYCNQDELNELVSPYTNSLKEKAKAILNVMENEKENIDTQIIPIANEIIEIPKNWEEFLFHTGKTLSSLSPADIDIFYDAVIQLQDQLPADFIKQLKPFSKKLEKHSDHSILLYIGEFFDNWLKPQKKYTINTFLTKYHPNPFFRNRNNWVLSKLKQKSKLPLLSTPTHTPFYVHPEILINKLAEYENAGETVELEDLIIACNRILKTEITEETKAKVLNLKGEYAKALQYLLGISTKIELDAEEKLLPLWAQVSRTTYPENTFEELGNTTAADYPSVVKPFYISYRTFRKYSDTGDYHWDFFELEHNWSESWHSPGLKKAYPHLYFYSVYNGQEFHTITDLLYWFSLLPHYADPLILHNLPNTSSLCEAEEHEYCFYPLRFMYENQIKMHHSGWIYVALCLLYQKKESRELAGEYINLAVDLDFINQDYLVECIAYMISNKFSPVNRLIEYFDKNVSSAIRKIQLDIATKCIEMCEKDSLPTNFEKIGIYYHEICSSLKITPDETIAAKLKSLKK